MPGVADAERRTRLAHEHKARKSDHEELLRLIKEGRLHEADERQLEIIKLSLEISDLLEKRFVSKTTTNDGLIDEISKTIKDALANIPNLSSSNEGIAEKPNRPKMRHVSLTDMKHESDGLVVQGELKEEEKTTEGKSKLEKLRQIKGNL